MCFKYKNDAARPVCFQPTVAGEIITRSLGQTVLFSALSLRDT